MPPGRVPALLACALALQLLAPSAAEAGPRVTIAADFAGADLAAAARGVASGGRLTISGLALEGEAQPVTLELHRRDVWAAGARIVTHTEAGPQEQGPPASRLFHGAIAGQPHSSVALAVHEDGNVAGIAANGEASWALGLAGGAGSSAPGRALLSARRAALEAPQRRGRRCGNKGSEVPPGYSHLGAEYGNSTRRLQVGGSSCLFVRAVRTEGADPKVGLPLCTVLQPPSLLTLCMPCHHWPSALLLQAATVLDQPLQATLAIDS